MTFTDEEQLHAVQPAAERFDPRVLQMVQKQVGDEHAAGPVSRPLPYITGMPLDLAGQSRRSWRTIKPAQANAGVLPVKVAQEGPVTGPQFTNSFAQQPPMPGELPEQPAVIAHQAVNQAQIATAPPHARIIGGQQIEQLGLKATGQHIGHAVSVAVSVEVDKSTRPVRYVFAHQTIES